MIKSYIVELQFRLQALNQLIGNAALYELEAKACKEKLEQIQLKISTNKDTQRKYQKLTSYVEKYNDTLDGVCTKDKVNIVVDELDNLNQIVDLMNRIEKNLAYIEADEFKGTDHKLIGVLATQSSAIFNQELSTVQITKYSTAGLDRAQEEERKEMNALMELNYRMINNINEKVKLAYGNKIGGKKA